MKRCRRKARRPRTSARCAARIFATMKITEDVRKYAAEHALSEQEALAAGMQEKTKEFAEAGNELYVIEL